MNSGRKTIPTKLKILKGTAQKCRILLNEMAPDKIHFVPKPPEGLNKHGKKAWNEACIPLIDVGVMIAADKHMLTAFCMEWGKYMEYEERLRNEGRVITIKKTGYKMPNPFVAMSRSSLDMAMKLAQQFGFTPSSRTRIAMPTEKAKKESPQNLLKLI